MNRAIFMLKSRSMYGTSPPRYGEVDVLWTSDLDTPTIQEVVRENFLENAHSDFVYNVARRCEEFWGEVYVFNDAVGKYEKII